MKRPVIDLDYLQNRLRELLAIPSPVGLTDEVVRYTCGQLDALGIDWELTRRGAIRGRLPGASGRPGRAVAAHLDTLGAMVRELKGNGRLAVSAVGTWSSRFAENARATLFTDRGRHRGTFLPLLASGHAFADQVDRQPVNWDQLEFRLDEHSAERDDLAALGVQVGDYLALDPGSEWLDNGYIVSRYLDDKAGVAALLAACKALLADDAALPIDFHPLFTISEEVGSGASAVLHGDIAELLSVDIAVCAPGQNSDERAVSIAAQDASGPFDYHLNRLLGELAAEHGVACRRDIYRYYRCDSGAALTAGCDIRTALIGFGTDATHGYERTHIDALRAVAELIALYAQCPPVAAREVVRDAGPPASP